MRTLKVGLCGLSPIAARRPESTFFGRANNSHAAAYASHPGCEVIAVCDLRIDLVRAFRETWADTWPTVGGYTSIGQLLFDDVPDLLSVATPDDRHAEIVVAAAEAGVKGILCEKPIATSLADADRMIAAVEASGTTMVVNHTRRYFPVYHRLREVILAGEIGELRHVGCYFASPRAMLFRNGTHLLDMLCFLANSPVTKVAGELEPGYQDWDRYRGDGGHDPASEPTATARLNFANGVTGSYQSHRTIESAMWFDLIGTAGTIRAFDRYAELTTPQAGKQMLVPEPYDGVGLTAVVSELTHLLLDGGTSVSSPADARQTLAVLLGILESNRRGGVPVPLPEADPA